MLAGGENNCLTRRHWEWVRVTCSLCFLAVLGRGGAWYPKAILLTIFMTDSFVRARLVAHRPGESVVKAVWGWTSQFSWNRRLCPMREYFGVVIGTECTRAQEFSGNFPRARVTQCQGPRTVFGRYTTLYLGTSTPEENREGKRVAKQTDSRGKGRSECTSLPKWPPRHR